MQLRARARRGVRLLVAAVVLVLVAAGCGGGGEGSDDAVEIRFSWWGSDERARITGEAIDRFEEAHPNIRVKEDYTDFDAYFDRLATSVAANDAPDVITLGGAYPAEYAGRGALLDLGEVSDTLRTDQISPNVLQTGETDGVLYAVPTGVNAYAVFVDPQVFADAGVELPDDATWTWEDYARTAEEISANTPDEIFGTQDPTHSTTLEIFARQNGEPGLYTADGDLAISAETVAAWFEFTLGLRDSGAAPSADQTVELQANSAPEQQLIATNQAGMMLGWSNLLPTFGEAAGRDLQMLKIPGEGQGSPGMFLQPSQFYSISSRTEHPEEAAALIDFLINEPAAAEVILTDRGLSANAEVREAITPNLDDLEVAQAEFLTRVEQEIGEPSNPQPVGASETQLIVDRLYPEVLFERMTPEEAADQFVTEVAAALEQ